jgi:hypothetical protein
MSNVIGFESLLSPNTDAQIKTMWINEAARSYANNLAAWNNYAPAWYLMSTINMGTGLTSGTDQTWAIAEANAILANQPYAYGSQGLENGVPIPPGTTVASDLLNIQNGPSCSGNNCCSDNWCNARPSTIGRVPFIELQDCNVSRAAGGNTGCLSSFLAGTGTDAQTLSQVYVLASQHGTNVLEIYFNDLLCAFDPSDPRVPSTCTTGTNSVSSAYTAAIQTLPTGQPSGTGAMFGSASTIGGAFIF